jgi:ferredoxin
VKVSVDRSRCTGHGRCYMLAPEVYAEDERGHCQVLEAQVGPALEKAARMGAEACPEQAIELAPD